jgi:hypothetical protein
MKTLQASLNKVNVIHKACDVLAGEHHHPILRFAFGIVVMLCGVYIAKTIGHHHTEIIAFAGDTVGYGIHGVGLIPFVEAILKAVD